MSNQLRATKLNLTLFKYLDLIYYLLKKFFLHLHEAIKQFSKWSHDTWMREFKPSNHSLGVAESNSQLLEANLLDIFLPASGNWLRDSRVVIDRFLFVEKKQPLWLVFLYPAYSLFSFSEGVRLKKIVFLFFKCLKSHDLFYHHFWIFKRWKRYYRQIVCFILYQPAK